MTFFPLFSPVTTTNNSKSEQKTKKRKNVIQHQPTQKMYKIVSNKNMRPINQSTHPQFVVHLYTQFCISVVAKIRNNRKTL